MPERFAQAAKVTRVLEIIGRQMAAARRVLGGGLWLLPPPAGRLALPPGARQLGCMAARPRPLPPLKRVVLVVGGSGGPRSPKGSSLSWAALVAHAARRGQASRGRLW